MDHVLHLHFGHHQLDMVLVLGQVCNDAVISGFGLSHHVLHCLHLVLGLVLALRDVFVEVLDDLLEFSDAVDDVLVVTTHQSLNNVSHALSEVVLVCDAHGKRIKVLLSGELVEQASCDTGDLLALEIRFIGELWPLNASGICLLFREEAKCERLAGFLELASLVKLEHLLVGHVGARTERHRFELLEAIEFSHPILRLSHQVEYLEGVRDDQVHPAHPSEELAHILSVYEFEDSYRLSPFFNLFADEKLVQVVEALLFDNGIASRSEKDNLVVVWAVCENFVSTDFFFR